MSFSNEEIKIIGEAMMKNPENYTISPDSRIFTKCVDCDSWHAIHELALITKSKE